MTLSYSLYDYSICVCVFLSYQLFILELVLCLDLCLEVIAKGVYCLGDINLMPKGSDIIEFPIIYKNASIHNVDSAVRFNTSSHLYCW